MGGGGPGKDSSERRTRRVHWLVAFCWPGHKWACGCSCRVLRSAARLRDAEWREPASVWITIHSWARSDLFAGETSAVLDYRSSASL